MTLRITRRLGLAAAGSLALPGILRAQNFPDRPIRLILPYTTGGAADAAARAFSEHAREVLGQPIVVESRPGANSMVGAQLVARAPADGYTLLYCGWPTLHINPIMYRSAQYRLEQFAPITTFFRSPLVLAVRPDFPANDLGGYLAEARRRGGLTYGTSGIGSSSHLLMERIRIQTGAPIENAAYRGEGPAATDVAARHAPAYVGSWATPLELWRAGRLKMIGHSGPERVPFAPEVPTFREGGFAFGVFSFWHGLAAPAGTPEPIIQRLQQAFAGAVGTARVRQALGETLVPFSLTPAAFAALVAEEVAAFGPIIRDNNLVVD
jgi:tripartite-type tricarboxylate transporter receptor subunit TctC